MNADKNWERYQPGERESRGGSQSGLQYSDAYGTGGGAEGNRIINDIHCKNATFSQQGFPDSAQLLPDEQGGGSGPEGDGGQRWQHGGHGHHGHHGGTQAETQNLDFDANGNPLPGTVEASEMGMNTIVPRDANGNPIYSTLSQPSGQPVDYSAPAAVTPQSDASNAVTAQSDASNLLISQLSSTNPDVAQVLTDAQNQISPQGYAALSQLMQQNMSQGSDAGPSLVTSISQLQQLCGQNLAPDLATLQNVIQTDAPNLLPASGITDAGSLALASTTSATSATAAAV